MIELVSGRTGKELPFKRVERRLAGRAKPRTDLKTSERMGRIRQRDTAPEMLVRRTAASVGLHYRTRNRDLPGSPDLANRRRRWAIFVHGCYWHCHAGCARATIPKTNRAYWLAKFERNRARDANAQRSLLGLGYSVVVIWECEVCDRQSVDTKLKSLIRR